MKKSLTKPGPQAGGFSVDPEAVPALRTAFEEAIQEMVLARDAMYEMRSQAGESVNPVVDKYLAALREMGYGEQVSATMAADSAIAEYQDVIGQLNQIMVGCQNREEAIVDRLRRLR